MERDLVTHNRVARLAADLTPAAFACLLTDEVSVASISGTHTSLFSQVNGSARRTQAGWDPSITTLVSANVALQQIFHQNSRSYRQRIHQRCNRKLAGGFHLFAIQRPLVPGRSRHRRFSGDCSSTIHRTRKIYKITDQVLPRFCRPVQQFAIGSAGGAKAHAADRSTDGTTAPDSTQRPAWTNPAARRESDHPQDFRRHKPFSRYSNCDQGRT